MRDLAARLERGETQAMSWLFESHRKDVHHVLLHLLGAESEVQDLLHDVMITAIERITTLEDPEKLRAWLCGIAVFKARAFLRRRAVRNWCGSAGALFTPVMPSESASPDTVAALRVAYAVLDGLPTDERIAFVLRRVDGMKLKEVAECCDTSLATAKRRLARAEQRFRALAHRHALLHGWLESNDPRGRARTEQRQRR